jgi:hypothetical protein
MGASWGLGFWWLVHSPFDCLWQRVGGMHGGWTGPCETGHHVYKHVKAGEVEGHHPAVRDVSKHLLKQSVCMHWIATQTSKTAGVCSPHNAQQCPCCSNTGHIIIQPLWPVHIWHRQPCR